MLATWVGGLLLGRSPRSGVKGIVYMSLVCFIVATILAFLAKRTLRSSPASVSNHEGERHEKIHQRSDLSPAR
jgi:hypothetical protein